jgi:hypothetical protein
VTRKKKDGTSEDISCPQIEKQYNANIGFVDKADMLKSLYETERVESGGCGNSGISLVCQWSVPSFCSRKGVQMQEH